jgi:DNA-directed RNA polymerase subunit beta'
MYLRLQDNQKAAKFLDDIKELGFQMAYKGGLSMGLNDVKVPEEKQKLGGRCAGRG